VPPSTIRTSRDCTNDSWLLFGDEEGEINFDDLSPVECEKIKFEVSHVERILSSRDLFVNTPDYVNGRSTVVNIELMKTALALMTRGLLDFRSIHEILIAFDTKCKELDTDSMMPLNEKIIDDSLRPIGLSLPPSVFQMWCRKCWQYL